MHCIVSFYCLHSISILQDFFILGIPAENQNGIGFQAKYHYALFLQQDYTLCIQCYLNSPIQGQEGTLTVEY